MNELAVEKYRKAAAAFQALGNNLELARVIQALAIIAGRSGNWAYFHRADLVAESQLEELGVAAEEAAASEIAALRAQALPVGEQAIGDFGEELQWLLVNDPCGQAPQSSIRVAAES